MSPVRCFVRPLARTAALLLLLAGLALVWPQSLGGRTAYVQVNGDSMEPTMSWGDLAVVRSQSRYDVGDAVVYRIPAGDVGAGSLVIHRIVGGDGETGLVARGDNRTMDDPWRPRHDDVVGTVQAHVPGGGAWFGRLAQPMPFGALIGTLTMLCALPGRTRTEQPAAADRHPVGPQRQPVPYPTTPVSAPRPRRTCEPRTDSRA
jgi:signal peptidase